MSPRRPPIGVVIAPTSSVTVNAPCGVAVAGCQDLRQQRRDEQHDHRLHQGYGDARCAQDRDDHGGVDRPAGGRRRHWLLPIGRRRSPGMVSGCNQFTVPAAPDDFPRSARAAWRAVGSVLASTPRTAFAASTGCATTRRPRRLPRSSAHSPGSPQPARRHCLECRPQRIR